MTTTCFKVSDDHKHQVFNSLLGYRMAMYKLMDLGLVSSNSIDQLEEWICISAGYETEEYEKFRNSPVNASYRQFMADFWEGADKEN